MDSLSQLALGAAVGVAVMGRRTALWKAALWGSVCGTLPDLDALIDFGDPVSNMTYHRAESHALFWLTLLAPLIAAGVARLHGEMALFKRWWLALWLVLVTHPLLDAMTVYGTQLLLPFSDTPLGVGSIFIIDPLYTLPLLVGVGAALWLRSDRGLRWNHIGLALSCAYLAWSAVAQAWVRSVAQEQLRAQGLQVQRLLVTPTPLNTVLWRVVAITPQGYHEGFRSLADAPGPMRFDRFPRGESLLDEFSGSWHVQRIAWFSRGFWKLSRAGTGVVITDLRMGQEPNYIFAFRVAERHAGENNAVPQAVGSRGDVGRSLNWLWQRMWGAAVEPPREPVPQP
jgi:inner membrane protein